MVGGFSRWRNHTAYRFFFFATFFTDFFAGDFFATFFFAFAIAMSNTSFREVIFKPGQMLSRKIFREKI